MVKTSEFYDVRVPSLHSLPLRLIFPPSLQFLGVPPAADLNEIKKAYYKKALSCHPDRHPGDMVRVQPTSFPSFLLCCLIAPNLSAVSLSRCLDIIKFVLLCIILLFAGDFCPWQSLFPFSSSSLVAAFAPLFFRPSTPEPFLVFSLFEIVH